MGGILFWEGRGSLKWGYILDRRVNSVSVACRCLKGGGGDILCERCI